MDRDVDIPNEKNGITKYNAWIYIFKALNDDEPEISELSMKGYLSNRIEIRYKGGRRFRSIEKWFNAMIDE